MPAGSSELEQLRALPREELFDRAWAVRQANFPAVLAASAPGARRYSNACYTNHPESFVNITLTGDSCALSCEHCQGSLLKTMVPARDPRRLAELAEELAERGTQGVLLSGGCDGNGAVPLERHLPAVAAFKERGLKVLVHSGLVDRRQAVELREAGVDQVLLDVIGDQRTIREVYHLDKEPEDYARALACLREERLAVVPHVIIGLYYGRLGGEYRALEMIAANEPAHLVLVVLRPAPGTPMEHLAVPAAVETGRIAAVARILHPKIPVSLGCARPAGREKFRLEREAVDAGVNGVAYPLEETIRHAEGRGLEVQFAEVCCSLLGRVG